MSDLSNPSEFENFTEAYRRTRDRAAKGFVEPAEIALLFVEYRRLRHLIVHHDGVRLIGRLLSESIAKLRSTGEGREKITEILSGLPKAGIQEASTGHTLVLDPITGSTFVALFNGLKPELEVDLPVPTGPGDELDRRTKQVLGWLAANIQRNSDLAGIACKGGMLSPTSGGTFLVDAAVEQDIEKADLTLPFNMGIPMALRLAKRLGRLDIPITTTDPFSVDEFATSSRITGASRFLRQGAGAHYCNHRATARLVSSILGLRYDQSNIITAHMGTKNSIVRHSGGKMEEVRNALVDLPGATRSGRLPVEVVLPALHDGSLSIDELLRLYLREGGLLDLTGTDDLSTLMAFRTKGATKAQNEKIELVLGMFAHHIASGISDLATCDTKPSILVLTGGMAENSEMVDRVLVKLDDVIPAVVIPRSLELEAFAAGNISVRADPSKAGHYGMEKLQYTRRREALKTTLAVQIFERKALRIKPDAPARSIDDIIQLARDRTARFGLPRIGIVGADNEEVIQAAHLANSAGRYHIAKFLLIGEHQEITRLAWEYDIDIDNDNFSIIDAEDPVARSMELYRDGAVNLLMKGSVTTEAIMHAFIETTKSMLAPGEKVFLSHTAVLEIPGKKGVVLMTDAAINPAPSRSAKIKIMNNALGVAAALNIPMPKIALISAIEKVNPSVASSVEAGDIAAELKGQPGFIVEGPLSVDVALDHKAAAEKGYQGVIQGDADMLVMPDIESGNVFYKSLEVSGRSNAAGVVVGGKVPLILVSRGDSAANKLASISLGTLLYSLKFNQAVK